MTLPLALAGGALTGLFAGGAVSAGTLFGFLTLFGIALRHGLLLIRRVQRLERGEGPTQEPEDAYLEPCALGRPSGDHVVRATRASAFPLVVTTVAVGLAVIPFMIRGTVPGVEFVRPLALVVLGGLVTTVFVTLFVLPALYGLVLIGRQGLGEPDNPPSPPAHASPLSA